MALLMGKGDLYLFPDYLKNYTEKSKGAVKPEIFNLISSQPPLPIPFSFLCLYQPSRPNERSRFGIWVERPEIVMITANT